MKKEFFPISRKNELVLQEIDGEVLIYDLRRDKALCLNEISAFIWKACDGKTSVSDLDRLVSQKFDSKGNEDLIWLALDNLRKEKLIENAGEMKAPFEGMSRREVIKKIGLSSMLILPAVTSLTAPTKVQAQTCLREGSPCSGPPLMSGCCPGLVCLMGMCN